MIVVVAVSAVIHVVFLRHPKQFQGSYFGQPDESGTHTWFHWLFVAVGGVCSCFSLVLVIVFVLVFSSGLRTYNGKQHRFLFWMFFLRRKPTHCVAKQILVVGLFFDVVAVWLFGVLCVFRRFKTHSVVVCSGVVVCSWCVLVFLCVPVALRQKQTTPPPPPSPPQPTITAEAVAAPAPEAATATPALTSITMTTTVTKITITIISIATTTIPMITITMTTLTATTITITMAITITVTMTMTMTTLTAIP